MPHYEEMKTCVSQQLTGKITRAYLSEKEVATYLDLSVNWLRKCRNNGTGPAWVKFEGCIRYPIADLQKYIKASRREFTGQPANENRKLASKPPKGGAK